MTIIEDTRQQAKKHELKHKFFADNQIKVVRCKLPVGDYIRFNGLPEELKEKVLQADAIYAIGGTPKPKLRKYINDKLLEYASISIDTKKDIQEIIGNVTKDHKRFIAECDLAAESDIKLIILIENNDNVKRINDLYKWYNMRLKHSPKATTGRMLAKILTGIEYRHNVKFEFCTPNESGKRIIELLGGLGDG